MATTKSGEKGSPSKSKALKSQRKETSSKAASPSRSTTNPEDAEVEYEIVSANARALKDTKHTTKKANEDDDHNTAGLTTNTFTNVSADASTGVSVDLSAEALSQLATAAGDGPVQISGTMLAALLANIISLQGEVGGLQKELGGLKFVLEVAKIDFPDVNTNLQDLQYGSGRRFTLFPKLPVELRTMVWNFAIFAPRVLGVKRNDYNKDGDTEFEPSTGPNVLRYINTESRKAAMEVQKVIIDQNLVGEVGLFFNPLVDIVWFHHPTEFDINDPTAWGIDSIYRISDWGKDDDNEGYDGPEIPRFAVGVGCWEASFSDFEGRFFLCDRLGRWGFSVKEAFVIVGKVSAPRNSPDLILIEPRQSVKDLLSTYLVRYIAENLGHGEAYIESMSWKELGEAEMGLVNRLKITRAKWRADMVARQRDPDNSGFEIIECQSCDDWTLEKIRFVELITRKEFNETKGLKVVE
ncbi:hypothetical protein DL95DRAFT_501109 [Leptodontidium sp. 2 PMI_412]|nr:hypothetical protein DL95DRAFT_501109 [Leptodontidium sp. 2 PMI_412]